MEASDQPTLTREDAIGLLRTASIPLEDGGNGAMIRLEGWVFTPRPGVLWLSTEEIRRAMAELRLAALEYQRTANAYLRLAFPEHPSNMPVPSSYRINHA